MCDPKKNDTKYSQSLDVERREVIKRAAQLVATAYIAPATVQLLTATRATAQSAVRIVGINVP